MFPCSLTSTVCICMGGILFIYLFLPFRTSMRMSIDVSKQPLLLCSHHPAQSAVLCFLCPYKHILKSSSTKQPLIPLAVPLISDEQVCPSLLFPVNKHLHPVDRPSRSNPLLSLIGLDVTDGTLQGRVDRRCNKTDINIQKLFVYLMFPSSVAGVTFK